MGKEIVWLKKSGQLEKGEPVLTIKSGSAGVKSETSVFAGFLADADHAFESRLCN